MFFNSSSNAVAKGVPDYGEDFFTTEELEKGDFKQLKDEVIFLVHLNEEFFELDNQDTTAAQETLKGFSAFLKSKIIANSKDKIGLVFYGSNTTNNELNFQGVDVRMPLDFPSAKRIKESSSLIQEFKTASFAQKDAPLSEALWVCSHMFQNIGSKEAEKRIFLFTSEDNPNRKDKEVQTQALHQAKLLTEKNIDIELFPLRINNRSFDYNLFFQEIVSFDEDELNEELMNPNLKISQLKIRLRRKEFKKRKVGAVDFSLGEGVLVGTTFYSMLSKAKKPSGVNLDKETNKQLMTSTRYFCAESGEELYENQVKTYLPLGGEKVPFSKEDVQKIKDFGKPSLTLLGFKPLAWLEPYYNNRSPYFLYPNNKRVENSDKFFDALIETLLSKKQIALVRFIPKQNSRMQFGALLPQREKHDEQGYQTPPGFNLIFLPYADDLKDLAGVPAPDLDEKTTPQRHQIIAAKRMINALTIDFDSKNFENPDIQQFYSVVQSIALEEEEMEEVEDYLQPDREGMKQLFPLIEEFKKNVYGEGGYVAPEERQKVLKALKKRDKPEKGGGSRKVGGKMDMEGPMTAQEASDFEAKLNDGTAIKSTKKEIQRYLRFKGLPVTGTKKELVEKALKKLKVA